MFGHNILYSVLPGHDESNEVQPNWTWNIIYSIDEYSYPPILASLELGVQNELRSNGAGSGGSAFLDYCTERRVCAFSRIVTEKSPSFSIDGLTEFCCAGGPKFLNVFS